MSEYQYFYSCNGCGTGSTCLVRIVKDGVTLRDESYQFPCSVTEEAKRNSIISIIPYSTDDTAFVNGKQIYPVVVPPGPASSNILIILVVLIAAYLVLRKI